MAKLIKKNKNKTNNNLGSNLQSKENFLVILIGAFSFNQEKTVRDYSLRNIL